MKNVKCTQCDSQVFKGEQTLHLKVVVNSLGEFIANDSPDGISLNIFDGEPIIPTNCAKCGAEVTIVEREGGCK